MQTRQRPVNAFGKGAITLLSYRTFKIACTLCQTKFCYCSLSGENITIPETKFKRFELCAYTQLTHTQISLIDSLENFECTD